jgi:hypothetical protein
MSDSFLSGATIASIAWFIFYALLSSGIDDSWRHQIADHGCAEFYLDQNKDRQWHWLSGVSK